MISRAAIEARGERAAGVRSETSKYYMVRVLDSFDMYCMKDDESVTPSLVDWGFWEAWITSWLLNNVDANTNFIDIGSNTGYYAFVARHAGANVVAFEPNPDYHEMIKTSQSINDLSFTVFREAVSDEEGKVILSVPGVLHGSASIVHKFGQHYSPLDVEVYANTLDSRSLLAASNLIIKIDAEGAEEKIWDGMTQTLQARPTVLLEYTPGAYSPGFIDKLEAYAPLMWLSYDGQEVPVDRAWIESQSDWQMIVLRG